MTTKLSYEEFFINAILKLRDTSKSRGIHSVFSGFNQAFRDYFGEDPIKKTQELLAQGKIEIKPVRKGVMIYLPGEAPKSSKPSDIIDIIIGPPRENNAGLVKK